MKILITGAAGFIGSHVAEHLAARGYDIWGIDNFSEYYDVALKRMNAEAIRSKGVHVIEADLNGAIATSLPGNFDYIFHFAAQPGISATTPLKDYVKNNIFATQHLLDWTLKHNRDLKCFVNIATSSIYGKTATRSEAAPPEPISFYGATKLAAEQLVLGEQRLGKLCACSLRLYSVYGPRERPEKLYTKLIAAIFKNEPFPLYEGSAKHSRSFTYVGDIVDGIVKIIGREDRINGTLINLGSDVEYTTGHGIALIEKITGKKATLKITPPRPGDQLKTTAIIDKARKLLEYNPSTSFEAGLRHQVDWYKAHFLTS